MAAIDPAKTGKVIKDARPGAGVGFAFAAGASADLSVLIAERGKTGDQLLPLARKEGGSKACGGTVYCEGTEAVFQTDSPLPGMAKQINEWFKRNKISLKSTVADAASDSAEADDEEQEDGPALFRQETVQRGLMRARRKPMNFAFSLGRSPDDHALALHSRKAPEQLMRLARKESGTSRGGCGTMTAEGARLAEFHCDDTPVPGMRRALRILFKHWGLKTKVKIFGPDGEINEPGDEEDEDDAVAVSPAQDGAADAAELERLRTRLQELFPALKRIADTDPSRAVASRSGYRACDAALKGGDVAEAARLLGELEGLAASPGSAGADAAVTTLRTELERLMPGLKLAAKLPDRTAAVREQWKLADTALRAGSAAEAQAPMARLRSLAAAPAGGGADLEAARSAWSEARAAYQDATEEVDRQISALQNALRASDDEELEDIAETGLNGITGNFRVPMMAAVADLDRAAGEAFRAAAAKALSNIKAFHDYIEADERVEAVDENPFGVRVSIRGTLGGALSEMQRALSMAVG